MFESHLILRLAIVQNKFQQANTPKINHINNNHINFEVCLHFWGIWPTVRCAKNPLQLHISYVDRPILLLKIVYWPNLESILYLTLTFLTAAMESILT